MTALALSVLLTRSGVNMGDHAQDVVNAVAVEPGETVEQLVERTLTQKGFALVEEDRKVVVKPGDYLTIRVALQPQEVSP